jgi:hypothetical protein
MMVGHTHDDIDALFVNYSTLMKRSDALTIPELMQLFRECNKQKAPAPYLVHEVPDWKGFVKGYIPEKKERLVGHLEPLLFKFCQKDGWPLMFYKMKPGHREWLPEKGIKMWKADANGAPMLPPGVPKTIPPSKALKDIVELRKSITKYITHWLAISQAGEHSWSNRLLAGPTRGAWTGGCWPIS